MMAVAMPLARRHRSAWSRLTPYPCWQVDWATTRQARSLTVAVLGGRG